MKEPLGRGASRAWQILREEGPGALVRRVARRLAGARPAGPVGASLLLSRASYHAWIAVHEPGPEALAAQRQEAPALAYSPLISLITPVHEPPLPALREMVASVQAQTYRNWELCLAGGAPEAAGVREALEELAAADTRVRLTLLPENRGISGNSNAALEAAQGEFVAFLDQDDRLAPSALFELGRALNEDPGRDLIYSDHDLLAPDGGERHRPLFKPDWSPEIMLSANYITHLTAARRSLVEEVGGFDPEMDGAQDWDLFLRLSERTERVHHIPKILYHWRESADSTAGDIWAKPYAPSAQLRAIGAHLQRLGLPDGRAFFDPSGFIRVAWATPAPPFVSIIIPTRGAGEMLAGCVRSILAETDYPDYEVLIVNNGPELPEAFPLFDELASNRRVRVVHFSGPFNYSAVNNFGASRAAGELLLFLNNDTLVISADWLSELARWAARPEVGVVGAKLLLPEGLIQHAGVIVGLTGFAGHLFGGQPEGEWTAFGLAEWYRDYLAVTGACLMIRRALFEEIGGFDESFLLCGSDVELCLRARSRGMRVVYNPFARLTHLESATRTGEIPAQDFACSLRHYRPALQQGDPYFNPNLSYWSLTPSLPTPDEPAPLAFAEGFVQRLGF